MPAEVTIRSAGPDDAELLAAFGRQAFADTFAPDNSPQNMSAYLDQSFGPDIQRTEIADPANAHLIATVGNDLAGYAMLRAGQVPDSVTGPRPIELVRLYAAQRWIGHGVGAALMQASLNEATARGFETVWLGVWEHNPRAREFYDRWNFIDAGAHVFQLGVDSQTDLLLERPAQSPPGDASDEPAH